MSAAARNLKLEKAIDDALSRQGAPPEMTVTHDAAAVARVVTRWHGDTAADVLRCALALAEAAR